MNGKTSRRSPNDFVEILARNVYPVEAGKSVTHLMSFKFTFIGFVFHSEEFNCDDQNEGNI